MGAEVGRRLVQTIPVVFFSVILVFMLLRLTPGDPALMYAGPDAAPEVIAVVRERMGLDLPLPAQFFLWLARAAQGDFGRSFASGIPVADLIRLRFPATLELAVSAVLLTILVAIPVGTLAAVRRGGPFDVIVRGFSVVGLAVPNFWIGILLIIGMALFLDWLPPGGYVSAAADPVANLRFLVLPAVTLSIPNLAVLIRFVRSAMLDVLHSDYVRTARAKGLSERAVQYRHALKNALIPVLTVLGLQFGRMLGGAVIVEAVFAWPGMGQLMLQGVGNRDYAVVQGALLVFVLAFVMVSVLIDIATVVVNPRLRGQAI